MAKLSDFGRRVWAEEIERAYQRINAGIENPHIDVDDYNLSIDPEDFLRLINGEWDADSTS